MTLSLPYNIVEHQSNSMNPLDKYNIKKPILKDATLKSGQKFDTEFEKDFEKLIKDDLLNILAKDRIKNDDQTIGSGKLISKIKDIINTKLTNKLDYSVASTLKGDDSTKASVYTTNYENNKTYIENQIRLNNLNKINRYKEIHIIIMYIILFISCGLFAYFYKK